jgi:5'-deoxynucleotidase YfbR-like HD superfamily hydrolase
MTAAAFGVLGSTIKLFTGGYYDVKSPRAEDVRIEDIAHVLANICRFGGHIPRYYSVAEHSVQCYRKACRESQSWEVRFACLMHDASEAYIGDVVKPLKVLLDPIYGPIENANERAIAEAFGIDFASTKPEWKRIDREMLIAERNAIFGNDGHKWTDEDQVATFVLQPDFYSPIDAESKFLNCFEGCFHICQTELAAKDRK